MNQNYEIRPYAPGDEEQIVKLLDVGFEGWPKIDITCSNVDYWRWRYLSEPFATRTTTVAVLGDEMVGVNHQLQVRIKIQDDTFICNYAGDLVIHPGHRGRGISNKLFELCRSLSKKLGISISYYTTSNPILIESYSRRYNAFPHRISNLVRVLDIDKQMSAMPMKNQWKIKLGFRTLRFLNELYNLIHSIEPAGNEISIETIDRFDEEMDQFFGRVMKHHYFIVERNSLYLNWRFCDHRAGGYIVRRASGESGCPLGYSVLKVNRYREDYPVGFIVDLLALPERPDVAHALASDAVRIFDKQDINVVSALIVKGHPYEFILKKHLFLDSRFKVHLFYTLYGGEDKLKGLKAASPTNIYFSYGDVDTLPTNVPRYI